MATNHEVVAERSPRSTQEGRGRGVDGGIRVARRSVLGLHSAQLQGMGKWIFCVHSFFDEVVSVPNGRNSISEK